jgi:hypothetical protein
MKRLITLMIATGLCLGLFKVVHAGDNIVITITPSAYYAVDLATDSVQVDLGTVTMSGSTQTVSPATASITSTYASTDLRIQGSINSVGANWSFDGATGSIEPNSIAAWAVFTSTTRQSAPSQGGGYFSGTSTGAASDLVAATQHYIGTDGTDTDMHEAEGETDLKEMDGMATGQEANLWLFFRMPNSSDDDDPQEITFTLAAGTPQP